MPNNKDVGPAQPLDVTRPERTDFERPSEDDLARERLGPRGVPGEPDADRMTPARDKKTPRRGGNAPEHTA
jgi:hypothetical protein